MMSNLLYSQTGLPKQILYNGDTVEIISMHQLKMLNIAHDTWLECADENDSLMTVLDSCNSAFNSYNDAITSLRYQVHLEQEANLQKLQMIDTLKVIIADQKKAINHLKFHRTLSTVGEAVLGIVIVWLLLR